MILFVFFQKYEPHKAVFSNKKLLFQEEAIGFLFTRIFFRYFTKKPKLNYVPTFVYENEEDKKNYLSSNRESDSQKPVNWLARNKANHTEKIQRT